MSVSSSQMDRSRERETPWMTFNVHSVCESQRSSHWPPEVEHLAT